jgi:hypothetical protein
MLVQTPFAQSMCNLLRGFCNHNNSIANNPSELQKYRLYPLIHTQVGCTVARSVGLGKVTFD